MLSDSEGTDLISPNDRALADEVAELQADHNAIVDSLIFSSAAADNPFLASILAATGGNKTELVENQFDLSDQLSSPLFENLDIV